MEKCFDKTPTNENIFEVWEMRHGAALTFISHPISICRLLKMLALHHLKMQKAGVKSEAVFKNIY